MRATENYENDKGKLGLNQATLHGVLVPVLRSSESDVGGGGSLMQRNSPYYFGACCLPKGTTSFGCWLFSGCVHRSTQFFASIQTRGARDGEQCIAQSPTHSQNTL